jgi:hypothetical protein
MTTRERRDAIMAQVALSNLSERAIAAWQASDLTAALSVHRERMEYARALRTLSNAIESEVSK